MVQIVKTEMRNLLRCPCPNKATLDKTEDGYQCTEPQCQYSTARSSFKEFDRTPVLIAFDRVQTICDPSAYSKPHDVFYVRRHPGRTRKFIKRILFGRDVQTEENCGSFIKLLHQSSEAPLVLVIGSGEKGGGTDALWNSMSIRTVGIDIYPSESVDYIADAHHLPFADASFDGVWIQAVLEHVADPVEVVQEIERVLKVSGVVYSEIPFMQQIHEGAFDFTRYTASGHRFLFRRFRQLALGPLQGPGAAFAWSFRYLIWAVTRSRNIASVIAFPAFIAGRCIDNFLSAKARWDGASATYFMGQPQHNRVQSMKELRDAYGGIQ